MKIHLNTMNSLHSTETKIEDGLEIFERLYSEQLNKKKIEKIFNRVTRNSVSRFLKTNWTSRISFTRVDDSVTQLNSELTTALL
jgi:hypothetical protein